MAKKINDLVLAGAVVGGMQLETDTGGIFSNRITIPQLVTYLNATLTKASCTVQVFTSPADFTPGVTTFLDLAIDPLIEANLEIHYNGLKQNDTEWTITTGGSPKVNFTSTIPVGVTNVEARIFRP
jgi:hypothetical protein